MDVVTSLLCFCHASLLHYDVLQMVLHLEQHPDSLKVI